MNAFTGALAKRHRLTVADYHAMGRHGILAHDARVELIEGEIIDMAPIGTSHAAIVNFLNGRLARATDDAMIISPRNPLRLSDFIENVEFESGKVLLILSQDDERNPVELPVLEEGMAEVPQGSVYIVPEDGETSGHGTIDNSACSVGQLGEFLTSLPNAPD